MGRLFKIPELSINLPSPLSLLIFLLGKSFSDMKELCMLGRAMTLQILRGNYKNCFFTTFKAHDIQKLNMWWRNLPSTRNLNWYHMEAQQDKARATCLLRLKITEVFAFAFFCSVFQWSHRVEKICILRGSFGIIKYCKQRKHAKRATIGPLIKQTFTQCPLNTQSIKSWSYWQRKWASGFFYL